jgi:hypothetical protein
MKNVGTVTNPLDIPRRQDGFTFKNKIINGNFDIWQRGTSLSTGGFLADRFELGVSGSTIVQSQQSFTIGQTDVPNNPIYYHRTVVTAGAGTGDLVQFIQKLEDVRVSAGKTHTVSFYIRAAAPAYFAFEIYQYFGDGGSTGVSSNNEKIAVGTSWQKVTKTVTIPSISGKTVGASSYCGLFLFYDAGSTYNSRASNLGHQSGTFDIAQVQIEEGAVATNFEQRPIALELSLCQRYYETGGASYSQNWFGKATNGVGYYFSQSFNVKKRSAPTPSIVSLANSGFAGALDLDQPSPEGFRIYTAATGTGDSCYLFWSWTADAEL